MESITLNPWAILYAAVAFQGLFVASILYITTKGNVRANKLLAVLILAFSWTRFQSFVSLSGLYRLSPHLLFSGAPLWFIFAPLYYFYVKALLAQQIRWNRLSVLHVLPVLAFVFYKFPFYILPAESKLSMAVAANQSSEALLTMLVFSLLYGLQNIFYLRLCLKTLQQQKDATHGATITAKPAHLSWLRFLFALMILFAVFHLAVAGLEFWTQSSLVEMDYIPMAFFSVMVYAIAYLAIQQPEKIFPPRLRIRKSILSNEMDAANSRQIIERLQLMMKTESPYRNSNLKYSELAARLGISVRLLSRILNEKLGKSFNDFVNTYRVQEVKDQLSGKENSEHTLLAIALDAGFNSKASFNRVFKDQTGMTPTEFVERQKSGQTYQ